MNKIVNEDKVLHLRFSKLGNDRRRLTNELLAILPEIYKKGIYKKYARDIETYAWKFGGLSYTVVRKRLRIEKYVYDKPMLKEAIRTEGVHKVAMLASLATKENEWALVDKLRNMSKPAIQELSKELRAKRENKEANNQNLGLFEDSQQKSDFLETSLCQAVPITIKLELDEEMSTMFLKLKRIYGDDLNNKEIMKKMMEELLELRTGKQKVKTGQKIKAKTVVRASENSESQSVKDVPAYRTGRPGDREAPTVETLQGIQKKVTRYVKIAIKREKLSKTGGKCCYPGCNRPAENLHHPERFAESKNHENLQPLCKIHHEFMHNGLVANQTEVPGNWQLSLDEELTYADRFYRHYRKT